MSELPTTELVQAALHVAEDEVPVAKLLRLGHLVGHAPGSVRVALTRLAQRGVIRAVRRGVYRHSARAEHVDALIRNWRDGEARRRAWSGSYLLACAAQGKLPQPLSWLGFAQDGSTGLVVRPDNLRLGRAETEARLRALGLDVAVATLDGVDADRWRGLWDAAALEASYRSLSQTLARSRDSFESRPLTELLVESLRLGHRAIQAVALDPLLPSDWLDPNARAELTRRARDYDEAGRRLWSQALEGTHRKAEEVSP